MTTIERPIISETAPVGVGAGYGGVDYIDPMLHRNINLGTRDEYLMDHDYDLHRRGKLSKKEHKRLYGGKHKHGVMDPMMMGGRGMHHLGTDRYGYDNWNYGHLVDFSPLATSGRYMPGMGYAIQPGMGMGMGSGMGYIPSMGYGVMPGMMMGSTVDYDRGLGLGGMGTRDYDIQQGGHRPGLIERGLDMLPGHHHRGTTGMGGGMTSMLPGMGMGMGGGMGSMMPGMGMGMGSMMPGMGMGMGGMGGMIDESRFLKLPHYSRINDNPNIDNSTLWRPRADIFDIDQEHLRVEFELPGVPREDISLTIQDNILTLAALKPQTRKEEVGFHYQNERHFGKFYRRMMLPFSVDPNKVKAHMDNGVLKVHLVRIGGVAGRIPIGEGLLQTGGSTLGSTATPVGSTMGSTLGSTGLTSTTPITSGTSTGATTTRI